MKSKMTTNSQLSTNEPKKQKLSKKLEQEQNHRNGDWISVGNRRGRIGGKHTENKKHNW